MRNLILSLLFIVFAITAKSQNGGQFPENNSVKLEFAGFGHTRLYNKQNCEAVIRVTYSASVTDYTVPANGSILINTAVPGTIKAKATTNCGSADFGNVELTITAQLLPVKFVSFKATALGNNKVSISFEIGESDNVDRFEVQLSTDGTNWDTVALVFPDTLKPNRLYQVTVDLSKKSK
jgi:hypothetical protein